MKDSVSSASVPRPKDVFERKYQGAQIAFDKNGEFNRNLNEREMIALFGEIINDNIKIPQKKLKSVEREEANKSRVLLPNIKSDGEESPDHVSNNSETKKENGGDSPTSVDTKHIDGSLRMNSSILTNMTKPNIKLKTKAKNQLLMLPSAQGQDLAS